MHLVDLLVHVNEPLESAERNALEEELRKCEGVIAPRFNEKTPHLLLVAYDPQAVDSRSLLDRVRLSGYAAQLVGM